MILTPLRLAGYGISGLPLAALGLPLYVYLPNFYTTQLGLGAATTGLVLLAARLFDVVSDPLVGQLSDRLPLFGTRRKGWMVLGLPLLLLGLEQLFRPAGGSGAIALLGWSLLAYLGWSLIAIPYTALGAEISESYHERSRISAAREGFVILGTALAILLPATLGIAADQRATLSLLANLFWLLLPLALLLTLWSVREPSHPRPSIPWREGLGLLRQNRPLQRLLGAYLLNGIANALPATLFLFFIAHVLQAEADTGLLLGSYFLSGLVALPLWLRLARRLDKHRAWSLSMGLAAAAFLWVPLLGAGDVIPFLLIAIISGFSLGADLALPASMQADVVSHDSQLGGGQRAGLLFGLWGITTKLSLALAVGIALPLLGAAGFSAEGSQSPFVLQLLALLYGGVPVLFKLGAIALVWRFPLHLPLPPTDKGETDDTTITHGTPVVVTRPPAP
jgi:GPH family glycoside/pentoside/hexuronide:cation symporter